MIGAPAMRELCEKLHAVMAEKAFGKAGVDSLFFILEILWDLYRHVEPSRIKEPLVVFCTVEGKIRPIADEGEQCGDLAMITTRVMRGLILEVFSDGRISVHEKSIADVSTLAGGAVVYEYHNGRERFLAGDKAEEMIRFDPTAHSQFAAPTFFSLREALRSYAIEQVRRSVCPVLSNAWADDNRLFFKPKPEEWMRKSLTHFLKSRLRASFEVRPEQVMDESHPVDIKVTYTLGKTQMIIEIKWLGDSRSKTGGLGTNYRGARAVARANEGAAQIVGYLEQNKDQAPYHVTQGYYVIIDARRQNLREDSTTISKDDGLYYADREIAFNPEYHRLRDDLDPPFRMFVEPIHLP